MKVALVHDWLTGLRGGEKCLEPLCRHFPDAKLLTLLHRPGSTSPAIERMKIQTSPLNALPGVARYYRALLPLMPWGIESLRVPRETELVVSLSHAVAKGVIAPRGIPHVCYCFTPMRYAWQLRDEYWPREGRRLTLLDRARDRLLDRLRLWDLEASRRVTRFIAISETVARRIQDCYGRPSTVIHPPVDTDFYTPDDSGRARDDGYLCVSALVPYKRIELAMLACRRSGRRLTVIGQGPQFRRLARLQSERVKLIGWQSDETIRDRLRRCRALIFPGHEDFGIVPVEAQACGAPVVGLNRGGLTETVAPIATNREGPSQRGTGVLYDENTVDGLIAALDRFERHLDRFDLGLARRQAERFSRPIFERRLLAELRAAHDGGAASEDRATLLPDCSPDSCSSAIA